MIRSLKDVIIVSEAVNLTGIPKSSITKFCREKVIKARLADGKIWLIDKQSALEFSKSPSYHPRMKRRKTKS